MCKVYVSLCKICVKVGFLENGRKCEKRCKKCCFWHFQKRVFFDTFWLFWVDLLRGKRGLKRGPGGDRGEAPGGRGVVFFDVF